MYPPLPLRQSYHIAALLVALLAPLDRAHPQLPISTELLDSIQTISGAVWSSNGKNLLFTSRGYLWNLSLQTGDKTLVLSEAGFSGTPRLSRHGDFLAIEHGEEIWIIRIAGRRVEARCRGEIETKWDIDPQGKKVYFGEPGFIWSRVSIDGRVARVKKSPEMFGLNKLMVDTSEVAAERGIVWIFSPYGSPLEWSPDGKRLYFLSARSGWMKIWSIKHDGSDIKQETFGDCDDRDFQVLDDGELLFVSNRLQKTEWTLWSQHRGFAPTYLFGQGGTVQSPTASSDGRNIAFLLSTPAQPSDIYVYDRISGSYRPVTESSPRNLSSHVIQAMDFRFRSSGREIQGLIYIAQGIDSVHRAPAIIKLHGGPSMHDGLAWNSSHQYLASRGFVVLAVNYTGSVGYGKSFEEADRFRIGFDDCDDVAAAARALQSLPYVRADRLGICGTSYGGYLTNLVIGRYPGLFSAAVSWYGIADWFTNDAFPRLHPVVKYFFRDRMGDPDSHRMLYRIASPVTFVDSIRTPLLLAHGDADTVVPVGQSEEFYEDLRALRKPVELSIYRGEGHGWSQKETRLDAFRRIEEWFNQYLKGRL